MGSWPRLSLYPAMISGSSWWGFDPSQNSLWNRVKIWLEIDIQFWKNNAYQWPMDTADLCASWHYSSSWIMHDTMYQEITSLKRAPLSTATRVSYLQSCQPWGVRFACWAPCFCRFCSFLRATFNFLLFDTISVHKTWCHMLLCTWSLLYVPRVGEGIQPLDKNWKEKNENTWFAHCLHDCIDMQSKFDMSVILRKFPRHVLKVKFPWKHSEKRKAGSSVLMREQHQTTSKSNHHGYVRDGKVWNVVAFFSAREEHSFEATDTWQYHSRTSLWGHLWRADNTSVWTHLFRIRCPCYRRVTYFEVHVPTALESI